MYIPKFYEVSDFDEIKAFIRHHPFGTVISTDNGRPLATHVPLALEQDGDEYFITSHLAKGNPQWRTLDHNEDVLLIFQGPHAYVSASWYEKEEVSTWNYQAVHVYGTSELMSGEELKEDLIRMTERYEKDRENPRTWDNLSDRNRQQIKGIVGFKVNAREIQASYKLSQNKSDTDQQNVIDHLHEAGDETEQEVAYEMERNRGKARS